MHRLSNIACFRNVGDIVFTHSLVISLSSLIELVAIPLLAPDYFYLLVFHDDWLYTPLLLMAFFFM